MVLIPPTVVTIIFAEPLVNIVLSSNFLPATPTLIILTFYTFIIALSMPHSTVIGGTDRPGIIARIVVVICIVNIILNYLFIPKNGLLSFLGITGHTGAAVATTLSASIGFFAYRFSAKKLTGIKLMQSHIPRHIIAGLVMAIVLYLLAYTTPFFPVINLYHLLVFSGIGLAIYLLLLFFMKEFKKQDLTFFLNLLHPKEMFNYVKSELKEK